MKLFPVSFGKISGVVASICIFSVPSAALSQTSCGDAQVQLQQYANEVNGVTNFWINQGIPQRCYGNQYCMATMLQELNYWYQQQAGFVNQAYYRIASQCTSSQPTSGDRPAPRDADDGVDTDAIDDLEVDDRDKTVAIVIPDNPSGFRPGAR